MRGGGIIGRRTKLTPETQKRIIEALKLGATYEDACNYGGISFPTFISWRDRGEAETKRRENSRVKPDTPEWEREGLYLEFLNAIKRTEGEATVMWLAKIEKAATDNWQAAAWKLERRYPDRYGRKVQDVNMNATVKGDITINLLDLPEPI